MFARHGATVVLTDRSERRALAAARDLTDETGVKVVPLRLDVGDEESIDAGVREALELVGGIDVLVNNAAVIEKSALSETTLASWNKVIGIGLTGTFLMIKAVLPSMVARGGGAIVNISSVAAWRGPADATASYQAAKAGVLALTRAAASEYGPAGVRVNCVAPGFVPNPGISEVMGEEYIARTAALTPLPRTATPQDIANAVFFLASEQGSFVTGEAINVSGGFYYHA
jgi:3-oxoacyl-[acyl-carrier protein] reductase